LIFKRNLVMFRSVAIVKIKFLQTLYKCINKINLCYIFFRLLLLLINIDQETVLNWFGIENFTNT
jgi:hypothetical protein